MENNNAPVNRMIDAVCKPTNYTPEPGNTSPFATHEGVMKIGDIELRVYVLNTGERIIKAEDLEKFFGAEWEEIMGLK